MQTIRHFTGLPPSLERPLDGDLSDSWSTSVHPHTTHCCAVHKLAASSMASSHFTRRYWGNHSCFLFLRLLICLNSAGSLARFEADSWKLTSREVTLSKPQEWTRDARRSNAKASWMSKNDKEIQSSIDTSTNRETIAKLKKQNLPFGFSNFPAFKRTYWEHKLSVPFEFEILTFRDFCISRQLSHFAAFFIDTWPEWSTV